MTKLPKPSANRPDYRFAENEMTGAMNRLWRRGSRFRRWSVAALVVCGLANVAEADTITFGGLISQSTPDGTGPALNNPTLNNIKDLQPFSVALTFPGSITAPGTYSGSTLAFSVPLAPASETSFSSISLTITANGSNDVFSLLGCLSSGSGCGAGNQLDANFEIPAAMLNSQNVAAVGLDQPHPLDLLEDDSTTDIQGSITSYSQTSTPEPSSVALVGCVLTLAAVNRRLRARQAGTNQ